MYIHCVQVDAQDIAILRDSGGAMAHCPRSNRAHGHGVAPLAALCEAGLAVGLGTDSVVSAGDVSLWSEAAVAGLEGEETLRMLTDRKSTRLNSSHGYISYAVFCLKK